jgi:hypothetical protein
MENDFEHKKQGEILKLGLAEAKDGLKHTQSAVRILNAVADYYQRRKKQTGRVRRAPQSCHTPDLRGGDGCRIEKLRQGVANMLIWSPQGVLG